MQDLKQNITLSELQEYVAVLESEWGFDKSSSNIQTCLQLGEEVGELYKAVRKVEKMRIDTTSKVGKIDEELADILLFLTAIANRYGIHLETALREKQEINKKREWK